MTITLDGTLGITSPAETVQGALTTTGNTILGDASTDTLTVGVNGIVKDASGNVGIGTASPSTLGKLAVIGGAVVANGGGTVERSVGLWRNTAAITSITILLDSGNYAAGTTATLYGILKA